MEQLIEYFAVFGGLGWPLNIDAPLEELIVEHICDNYAHLYNEIALKTMGDAQYHRLLSAIATGDRRMHSAFKRAKLGEARGNDALNYLRDVGILELEYSRETPPTKLHPKQKLKREIARYRISHKVRFTSPFLRFWFYFIAPLHQEIEKGHYEPLLERFAERRSGFTGRVFEALSNLFLELMHHDDALLEHGSYWDRHVEIDILAETTQGRIIAGECKWTNHKINKSELSKLQAKCELIHLQPNIIAMFCKRGFSKEMEHLKSPSLELYCADDFQWLLQGVSEEDLIREFPRPN